FLRLYRTQRLNRRLIDSHQTKFSQIKLQAPQPRRLFPKLGQRSQEQVLVLPCFQHFNLAVVLEQLKLLGNLRYARLGKVIRAAFEQRVTLGLEDLSAHKIQRDLLIVDFGANYIAGTAAHFLRKVRGSRRFGNAQRRSYADRFIKLGDSVVPASPEFLTQGFELVLQLRSLQRIGLAQFSDLCGFARLVAGPSRLNLTLDCVQAVADHDIEI